MLARRKNPVSLKIWTEQRASILYNPTLRNAKRLVVLLLLIQTGFWSDYDCRHMVAL